MDETDGPVARRAELCRRRRIARARRPTSEEGGRGDAGARAAGRGPARARRAPAADGGLARGGAAFAAPGSINSPTRQPAALRLATASEFLSSRRWRRGGAVERLTPQKRAGARPEDLYVEYADESRAPAPRYAQMTLSQQRRRFGVDDYRAFRESVCSQPPHNWYDSKPVVGAY